MSLAVKLRGRPRRRALAQGDCTVAGFFWAIAYRKLCRTMPPRLVVSTLAGSIRDLPL